MIAPKYLTFLIILMIISASAGMALGTEILSDYEVEVDQNLLYFGLGYQFLGYLFVVVVLVVSLKRLLILKRRAAIV